MVSRKAQVRREDRLVGQEVGNPKQIDFRKDQSNGIFRITFGKNVGSMNHQYLPLSLHLSSLRIAKVNRSGSLLLRWCHTIQNEHTDNACVSRRCNLPPPLPKPEIEFLFMKRNHDMLFSLS